MAFIKTRGLKHEYITRDETGEVEEARVALKNIDLEIKAGDFTRFSFFCLFLRHLS